MLMRYPIFLGGVFFPYVNQGRFFYLQRFYKIELFLSRYIHILYNFLYSVSNFASIHGEKHENFSCICISLFFFFF